MTSIGALVGALATARRKSIDVRMVALTSLGFGAAMAVMTFAPTPAIAFPIVLFVGLGSIAFLTASTAIVQIRSDPMMRGRVLALQAMVFLGSTPIGGPIVGWICQNIGPRYGVAVGAVAALGAGAWGLMKARSCAPAEPISSADGTKAVELAIADLNDDVSEAEAAERAPEPRGSGNQDGLADELTVEQGLEHRARVVEPRPVRFGRMQPAGRHRSQDLVEQGVLARRVPTGPRAPVDADERAVVQQHQVRGQLRDAPAREPDHEERPVPTGRCAARARPSDRRRDRRRRRRHRPRAPWPAPSGPRSCS